ncbi:hypothetical protein E6C76_17885 [Pseudothauera nasutitermitis]|uniref:UDP-3-O-(3-hydroxymyristoyl)glucosamine N-acyltransferase n=1 Tax=Pseudothauera nasutitermitis TaxID=2565930 RepID=A0A4S4ATQ3_9RHOO|nr:UDP-3-O-(3-hydroxymyristoyl)glucosamine N-acyltransferase [Pseudothauera nasutitermitis]THF63120.1 hypothetical protein E6C76_17885 [Pseudothauera nasutitermitis]
MLNITIHDIESFSSERCITIIGKAHPSKKFTSIKPIALAKPEDVSFCRFEGEQGVSLIKNSSAGLLFIPFSLLEEADRLARNDNGLMYLACETPRLELAYFLKRFWIELDSDSAYTNHRHGGLVHPQARISNSAKIMKGAIIGKNVSIGDDTVIFPGAVIENAMIGNKCSIGANAVIGGIGFGFEKDPATGEIIDFPHIGTVRMGDNVRVGACTCIDRASIGETILGDNVKIDNLCHIGHNVKIGNETRIVALSIIGGSTRIGKNCWLAPASAIRDWIDLGDEAIIGMGAVVTKSVESNTTVIGNPARPIEIKRKKYL